MCIRDSACLVPTSIARSGGPEICAIWRFQGYAPSGVRALRVLFVKYHEAADQQPLSRRAAEKLGIFPSLPLASLARWVRQHGFDVRILARHVKNIPPQDAARDVAEYDPQVVAITVKTLGWPACIEIAEMVRA